MIWPECKATNSKPCQTASNFATRDVLRAPAVSSITKPWRSTSNDTKTKESVSGYAGLLRFAPELEDGTVASIPRPDPNYSEVAP